MNKTSLALVAMLSISLSAVLSTPLFAGHHLESEQTDGNVSATITKALAAEIRGDDGLRDDERKPLETLTFFGLQEDMRVLELIPGGGWYTKILAQVLADQGQLYLGVGVRPERLQLEELGLTQVKTVAENVAFDKTEQRGVFNLKNVADLGVEDLDMALTFRNAHNLTPQARIDLNKAVFAALKPGGIYGVIDHTKRHNQPDSEQIWRREDPVQIIKEVLEAGFEFVDYSDIHYRSQDDLTQDSTHESLNRNSDRFTLKFRKPQ